MQGGTVEGKTVEELEAEFLAHLDEKEEESAARASRCRRPNIEVASEPSGSEPSDSGSLSVRLRVQEEKEDEAD